MEAKHNPESSRRQAISDADSSNSDHENGHTCTPKNENYLIRMSQYSSYHSEPRTENIQAQRANKNKTDDDKIHADKIAYNVKADANRLPSNPVSRECTTSANSDEDISPRSKLPDLIPNVSPYSLTPTMDIDNHCNTENTDSPPPLPVTEPPDLQRSLSSPPVLQSTDSPPPPLPISSPPPLAKEIPDSHYNISTDENSIEGDESECDEHFERQGSPDFLCYDHTGFDNSSFQKKEEREHLLSDYDSDTTLEKESEQGDFPEKEQKSEFDIDNEIQVINAASRDQINGVDNVVVPDYIDLSTAEQTFLSLLSEFENKDKSDSSVDFDDEFEAIFNSINASSSNQEPYLGRFAGRRDKYGFILSPIVESPSPTPSCMSNYSGLSSASPDIFSMFRVSPAPRAGKRELDLSSLSKSVAEWEAIEEEQTVPIYHTRTKLDINIPESTGWESGDDLLTPTSATEWDATPSGLSTPPANVDMQLGAQLKSLLQPSNIIYEESESSSAECDSDNSDDTLAGSNTYLHDKESDNELKDTRYIDKDATPGYSSCMQEDNTVVVDTDVQEIVTVANACEKAIVLDKENDVSDINSEDKENCNEMFANVNNENMKDTMNDEDMSDEREQYFHSSTDAKLRQTLKDLGCFQTDDTSDLSDSDHVSCDSDDEYFEETGNENNTDNEAKCCNNEISTNSEQSINLGEYHECLNSTAYIFVPTSSVVVSGTMTPDNIDSASSTDEEPESPNMSSFGSGVKVSQYTSGDSESTDSESNTNDNELDSESDRLNQNNEKSLELHDLNCKEKSHIRFHSPLDFSFFEANNQSMTDKSPRSPRVLGRHYMEMGDNEKTFCTSPPVMTEFECARNIEHVDTNSYKDENALLKEAGKTHDMNNPDLEDSFQTVQFLIRENGDVQEKDPKQNQIEISPVSSDSESDVEHRYVKKRSKDDSHVTNESTNDNDLYDQHYPGTGIASTESQFRNNEFHIDRKISKSKRSRKAAPPVKIKIANLKRKVSSRNKIKPGYVKQVSQLFSDDGLQDQDEVRMQRNDLSSSLPFTVYSNIDTLMPNEEVEIFQNKYNVDNIEHTDSLQYEGEIFVTPLIQEQDDIHDDFGSATTYLDSTNVPDTCQGEYDHYNYGEIDNEGMPTEIAEVCNMQNVTICRSYDDKHETDFQQSLCEIHNADARSHVKQTSSSRSENQTKQTETNLNEADDRKCLGLEQSADLQPDDTVTENSSIGLEPDGISNGKCALVKTTDRENEENASDNAYKMISSLGFETTDIEKLSQACDTMSKIVLNEQENPNCEPIETDEDQSSDSDTLELNENASDTRIDEMESNQTENGIKVICPSKEQNENLGGLGTEDHWTIDKTNCLLISSENMRPTGDTGSPYADSNKISTNEIPKKLECKQSNSSDITKENKEAIESENAHLDVQSSSISGTTYHQTFAESSVVTTDTSYTSEISHADSSPIQKRTDVEYSDITTGEADRFSDGNYVKYASTNGQCTLRTNENDTRLPSFSELIADPDAWFSIVNQINKFKAATPSFFHKPDASASCIRNEAVGSSNGTVQYSNSDSFQDFQTTGNAHRSNGNGKTDISLTRNSHSNVLNEEDDICDNRILEDFQSETFIYDGFNCNDDLSDLELCMFTDEANDDHSNIFQHTFYDVRKPITIKSKLLKSTLSQSDYSSQAKRNNVTVNNTNANHSDTLLPLAKSNDASCDNGVFHFPMPACQSVVEANFVQVDSRCCIVNSENIDVISHRTEGEDKLSSCLTNECYRQNEGVHIPRRLTANKNTHQTVAMNYDTAANVNSDYDTRFHITRINGNDLGKTQDVFHSRMPRSDISANRGGSRFSQDSSVGVKTLNNPVLFQSSVYDRIIEDETGKVKGWPYSDIENQDRVPVKVYRTFKKVPLEDTKAQKQSAKMRIVPADGRSADIPDDRTVKKYHSSSVLPANTSEKQLMQSHSESIQEALQTDANGNMLNDEEIAKVLPKLAETITNMKNVNAEEVLPGITQTVAKLKDGGNLVITTMTRKLVEDEEEIAEEVPSHPVVDVDDLESSKIYLVQDSRGEMFYVEDVTSESQESAYFSSSRPTSESVSESGSSPTFQRISKIQQVGNGGINEATAEELISAMYDQNGVTEIDEFEDEYSERTYEFDLPKGNRYQDSFPKRDYNKDSFKTSYMVEEPDTSASAAQGGKTTTKDHFESSYQMTSSQPWVFDGAATQYGQQANFSNAMQASSEEIERASTLSDTDNIYRMQNTVRTADGNTITTEKYTIEAEAFEYPEPQPDTTVYAAPPAVYVPPPVPALPVSVQTDEQPNYSLVKVDMTPKSVVRKVESPPKQEEEKQERPIYKTVAHIETKERPRPKPIGVDMTDSKRYKIVTTKPTPVEEVQESQISLDEVDYRMKTENIEYKLTSPGYESKQYYVRNSSTGSPVPERFRSEKRMELSQGPNQKHKTEIQVKDTKDYDTETYEENSYSYDKMVQNMENTDGNMRVVRGSYLIKNTLDEVDGSLDDNLNLFDGNFTLRKDNPLYQSDEDMYKRFEREKAENERKQQRFQRDLNNDITFETVDKFSKSKEGI